MNVVLKTLVGGVAVLAFATLVATGLGSSRDEPQPGQTAASLKAVGDTRAHRIPSEAARTLPVTVSDAVSLRSWVERLLSPGTPRDRYQVFGVLAQCAHAIDFDRYLKSLPVDPESTRLRERYGDGFARIAVACGDLSARQLDLRVELAASAADEGIPGAASAWVEEGPFGDKTALTQRPDDPLVVEWVHQAIARVSAATKRADTEAISQFGLLCLNWEMDDVARVRLLVDAGVERRREDQIRNVVN